MPMPDTRRAVGPGADTATPVPDFARVTQTLDALATTDPLLVDPQELPGGVQAQQRIANQVGAIKARWVAATETRKSNGVERHAKWLSRQTGVNPDDAAREVAAANAVQQHQPVADAAAKGEISPDHARIIGRAARELEADQAERIVNELVGFAKANTPEQTARHARKLVMRKAEDRGLSQAQSQLAQRRFHFSDRRDGMVHGEGLFTPDLVVGHQASDAPSRLPASDAGTRVPAPSAGSRKARPRPPAPTHAGDAAIGGGGLPQSRGLDTLAMVIVDLDWVTQGHDLDDLAMREHAGAVTFDGEPLSAETARRIPRRFPLLS